MPRGVFVAACDRKRPEMRWRPDKDDEEQQQGFGSMLFVTAASRHGRRRAGRAAITISATSHA